MWSVFFTKEFFTWVLADSYASAYSSCSWGWWNTVGYKTAPMFVSYKVAVYYEVWVVEHVLLCCVSLSQCPSRWKKKAYHAWSPGSCCATQSCWEELKVTRFALSHWLSWLFNQEPDQLRELGKECHSWSLPRLQLSFQRHRFTLKRCFLCRANNDALKVDDRRSRNLDEGLLWWICEHRGN